MSKETMTVDGVEYVRADSIQSAQAPTHDGMQFAIIRTVDAGVHAGWVKIEEAGYIVLVDSRWLYEFYADNLFALAQEGSTAPEKCNYANPIPELRISENYSVIPFSEKGLKSFRQVGPWRK